MLLFFVAAAGSPAVVLVAQPAACSTAFYSAGALVFGGGHVVLPLLNEAVVAPGWVSQQAFLAGYGAAQAMPGPLFTFSAYLGAIEDPSPNGVAGAAIALVAIFLPSFLLLGAALPLWSAARERAEIQAAVAGVGAAVVGLLAAALWDPVLSTSVHDERRCARGRGAVPAAARPAAVGGRRDRRRRRRRPVLTRTLMSLDRGTLQQAGSRHGSRNGAST